MNKQHNIILTALFSLVIITGTDANVAHASESKGKLTLFSQVKISLIEAIKAAEQKTGGKALEAELDGGSSTVQFEIKILKDGKIYEVIIDGKTGNVLKVSLDD